MKSSDWTYEALYLKSQIYMERALQSDRNSGLFPFWASLALELIGRATLAKIHPALIADPREGPNIMHAFGYTPKKGVPKTIASKTIFLRLQIIIPDFTEDNEKFCHSFINMRNEELHTGTPIFDELSTNVWLTNFYKSIKILLEFQEKTLEDFLGKEEADIANQMIEENKEELISKVKQKVGKYKDVFSELEDEEKKERCDNSKKKIGEYIIKEKLFNKHKKVNCPSCNNEALLIGKYVSQSDPKVVDDAIEIQHNILPIKFRCFCCGLNLNSNGELSIVNLGGQFAITDNIDPVEYYEIDPIEELKNEGYSLDDLSEYFPEFDYGND